LAKVRSIAFEDLYTRPVPGILEVFGLRFLGPDLFFLRSTPEGKTVLSRFDLASSRERVVAGGQEVATSTEAELLKERMRLAYGGVISWEPLGQDRLLVNVDGSFLVISLDGEIDPSYDLSGAVDVHPIPGTEELVATDRRGLRLIGPAAVRTILRGPEGIDVGVAEYVAQEEFGRLTGIWPGPSGNWIACTYVDDRQVTLHPIVDLASHPATVQWMKYPFAGEKNAKVELKFVSAEGDLYQPDLPSGDSYLIDVVFMDASRAMVQTVDRRQQTLSWSLVDLSEREVELIDQETGFPWVNISERSLPVGGALLSTSERFDNLRHLVLIEPGREIRKVSDAVVSRLISADGNHAWAIGYLDDPLVSCLIDFDLATGDARIIESNVTAAAIGEQAIALVRSSIDFPPALLLIGRSESRKGAMAVRMSLPEIDLPSPEIVSVEAEPGLHLNGALYLPPDGKSNGRPAVVYVYGGPHVQLVSDSYALTADLAAQWLASKGVVVFKLDGRGSYMRGRQFEGAIAGRFGQVELEDQLRGVEYLVKEWGIDPARIGIYGWSYGGYLTLKAMTKAASVFCVGVAGAPVVDFRWYDTAYTERYLGLPAENPHGYEVTSVLPDVELLSGPLMVIHGLLDENVHVNHTFRLIKQATRAGKEISVVILADSRHGPRTKEQMRQVAMARSRFLLTHLGVDLPSELAEGLL
jgi:dipeptidyl-peptidase-4